MPNMQKEKTPMPSRNPSERSKDFGEVALGYTEEQAISEAERCLNCKNRPCCDGCPVRVRIPEFIEEVRKGEFEKAYEILTSRNGLPAICGRVCPQEKQCESKCVRGIKGMPVGIGYLERFVADWHNAHCEPKKTEIPSNGKRVAIVGSGPSSLTCAGDLAKLGYEVTVFEALHVAGGVLVYGIPEFRLPKAVVAREIENLSALGVKIEKNVVIGKTISIDELFEEGFESVFVGSGAGLPKFMGIKGENCNGVYSANEFLTRINLMKGYREDSATPIPRPKKAVIVGGGNVAMDAARSALRIGAESTVVYRRSEAELPARKEEIEHAKEEGVIFRLLSNPKEIIADENGNVKGVRCAEMVLGEPDASGRRRPVEKENSSFVIEADAVIMSIGNSPNPLIKSTTSGLATEARGGIIIDENGMTTREGVFAGGDAVTGAATVILAMGAGKAAAKGIHEYLSNK